LRFHHEGLPLAGRFLDPKSFFFDLKKGKRPHGPKTSAQEEAENDQAKTPLGEKPIENGGFGFPLPSLPLFCLTGEEISS
jgi:hypothetical protein